LEISNSSFPDKHPWFHVCELEQFILKDPKFYKPLFNGKLVSKILDCKFNDVSYFSEYLLQLNDDTKIWVDCYISDQYPKFVNLIKEFNSSYPEFS